MRQIMPRATVALLAAAATLVAIVGVSDAFGASAVSRPRRVAAPTERAVPRSADSALFAGMGRRRDSPALQTLQSLAPLFMASDENTDETTQEEAATEESAAVEASSSEGNDKESSGFITALLLAPPLFVKFVIVLCVKLITDIVVFPLLFLYRMARLAKNKVLGVFNKGGDSDALNGEGASS
uniref:Uncharacterized protein n=1 Tax=Odontella aurita TaxID=265563 RepID=A0A7S4NFP5_9STRA|mmetsp:Transcript_61801/g.182459  ORF Transcript_61801/g.182459 Transcript_61801/m.182459 type:complete len:183 (+) Transcript_61801:218-766(+)